MSFLILGNVCADQTAEEIFTNIYKNKVWGQNSDGQGTSGDGSTLEATQLYRTFLQDFFKAYKIHSVVDVGCGDWEFSRTINWDGIKYTGYDVVKFLIEQNQTRYGTPNINFVHANAVHARIPKADLLICKDVLQHLSNTDISTFTKKLGQFKFCLITNDVNATTGTSDNIDIPTGSYRHLDLTAPPFNLKAVKIFTFYAGEGCARQLKQVLLFIK